MENIQDFNDFLNESKNKSLIANLKKLQGKRINDADYDPYTGYFILRFTDGTSSYLGFSGFNSSRGDELYVD